MTISHDICPICSEGHLQFCVGKNTVEHKGKSAELNMQYSVCDACGSEQADAVQLRTNKRAMMAFRKQVDGLLMGEEVRALRVRLRINQAEAARIFGGGPVAFSKYESDDVVQSEAMDKLLRLAASVPAAFAHLVHEAGVALDVALDIEGQWATVKMERSQPPRPVLHVISESHPISENVWRKTA